jgi:ABC-2 type transport system ATP-binding protein
MSAILEVHELSKKYAKSDFVLDKVSFSLPSGTIMGLIGENGSGKTTTISCILGMLLKDSGTVRAFGKEMTDRSVDIRDDIGVVLDANNFSDDLTALKISSVMRLIYSGWNNALFGEYLERFKIPAKKRKDTFKRNDCKIKHCRRVVAQPETADSRRSHKRIRPDYPR